MAGGAIFCMKRAIECTTAPHARLKVLKEEPPVENNGVRVVMEKPPPRLPASAFFQPNLGASRAAKASYFKVYQRNRIPCICEHISFK